MNRARHDVMLDLVSPPPEIGVKLELLAMKDNETAAERAVEDALNPGPLTCPLIVLN